MRISRLTQENTRTQGPQRRWWYRRHSPAHLRSIESLVAAVLAARALTASCTAVVLGAGACTEVPLATLARACSSVLLVDVDVAGMTRARDELPRDLRSRVDLFQADLTGGVSAALAKELAAQPWADLTALSGPSGLAPLDAAAACLERCPIPNPPALPQLAPHGYGLVISSLTLTQLFSLPLLDVLDTLNVYAPAVAALRDTHPRYHAAATSFRRRIVHAHLALLGALLAPDGSGLLVTDVTGYLLPPASGQHAGAAAESLPVLPPDVLDIPRDLAERFAVVEAPRTWRWLVSAPDAAAPGRAYDVTGVVLRVPTDTPAPGTGTE